MSREIETNTLGVRSSKVIGRFWLAPSQPPNAQLPPPPRLWLRALTSPCPTPGYTLAALADPRLYCCFVSPAQPLPAMPTLHENLLASLPSRCPSAAPGPSPCPGPDACLKVWRRLIHSKIDASASKTSESTTNIGTEDRKTKGGRRDVTFAATGARHFEKTI